MSTKDLLITSIPMVDVDGSTNIPTALFYEPDGQVFIGSEALAKAKSPRGLHNADFKIELGNIDPTSTVPRRKFPTASGKWKSAPELTSDFLLQLLSHAQDMVNRPRHCKGYKHIAR